MKRQSFRPRVKRCNRRRRLACELLESRRVLAGPEVVSIVRADADPNGAAQIGFDITIDESVTGVDVTDFSLDTTGVTGASIASVSGSGAVYQVLVDTGSGDGTIKLDLVDNDSIINGQSEPLGGVGTSGDEDGSFSTGETYAIDKTPPTSMAIVGVSPLDVTITNAQTLQYEVTFPEPVTGVTASAFDPHTDSTGNLSLSVTNVSGSGTTYAVTIDVTAGNSGPVLLGINNSGGVIQDLAGNALADANGIGANYIIDQVAPSVTTINRAQASPTAESSLSFDVTFSENISGLDASDFDLNVTGISGVQIDNVSGGGSAYTVTVTHNGGVGTIGLHLVDDNTVIDSAGNPLGGSSPGDGDFEGQVYDVQLATVTGHVYFDQDSDGIVDGNETGLAGLTVFADSNDNGLHDVGEPSTLTLADDPGTAAIDEAGMYTLSGIPDGTQNIRVIPGSNQVQTSPVQAGSGALKLLDQQGAPNGLNLFAPSDLIVTPDGNFAVGVWRTGDKVILYSRDPIDGRLTYLDDADAPDTYGGQFASITPDGKFVYVPGRFDDAISVFSLNTGTITAVQTVSTTTLGNDLLNSVDSVSVSPDGENLVASSSDDHLIVFDIDQTTGQLTFLQSLSNGTEISSFDFPGQAEFSSDGQKVFVTTWNSSRLHIFDRDPATGLLTPSQNITLSTPSDVVVAPGDQTVYVSSWADRIYKIDFDPQSDSFAETYQLGLPSDTDPYRITLSPDGQSIYLSAWYRDLISRLSVDPSDGTLTFIESLRDVVDIDGFESPNHVVLSPDGRNAYVPATNSHEIATFWVDGTRTPVARELHPAIGDTVSGVDFAIATEAPRVLSIDRASGTITNASSVQFTVTFSEDVTGVGTDDFELAFTDHPNATISSVTGGPQVYTVTVDTSNGEGHVAVQAIDNGSIVDGDTTPTGPGNAAILERSEATIADQLAPQVVSITSSQNPLAGATSAQFYVTFTETISGVDAADFVLTSTGFSAASIDTVDSNGEVAIVSVNFAGASGTLELDLVDDDSIMDLAGNLLAGPTGASDGSFDGSVIAIHPPEISGRVFLDLDQDGLHDPGEVGRAGTTVFVDANNNGSLDAGELSTTTSADDPATSTIDEGGLYTIAGVGALVEHELRIIDDGLTQTAPLQHATNDGMLTFTESVTAPSLPNNFLYSANSVTVSPDGRHVYTTAINGHALSVFSIDDGGSIAAPTVFYKTTSPGFSGLSRPTKLLISSDGRFAYLATDQTIFVTHRDANDGSLTVVQRVESATGFANLTSVRELTLTPDGQTLFATDSTADSLHVFAVDPSNGTLSARQQLTNLQNGVTALDGVAGIAVTPDGSQLFVAGYYDSTVSIYDIVPGGGLMAGPQQFGQINHVEYFAISHDGMDAYINQSTGRIEHLRKDASGNWIRQADIDMPSGGAYRIRISPDGEFVYVANRSANGLDVFARDKATGQLTSIQSVRDVAPHDLLDYMQDIAISPNGSDLFAVAWQDSSLTRFSRLSGATAPVSTAVVANQQSNAVPSIGVFNEIPSVVSLSTAASSPTDATTIDFLLEIDKPVTGVDASDFQLIAPLLSGASITEVSGGPTLFTISVNTGDGEGDLQLRLNDNDSIVDIAGDPIGGLGDNASVTTAAIFVDHLAPTVTSVTSTSTVTNAAAITFNATFSETVVDVDISDFSITSTGVVGANIVSVTPTSGSDFDIVVGTGIGSGSVRLDVLVDAANPVSDDATNEMQSSFTSGQEVTVDRDAPSVSLFELIGDNQGTAETIEYRVTFSEDVTGVDAADFSLSADGPAGSSVQSVVGGPSVYTVTVGTGTGTGALTLNVIDDDSIADAAGNLFGGVGTGNGDTTGPTYTTNFPPMIASVVPNASSPSNQTTVDFNVTFDKDVSGVDTTDFGLSSATLATFTFASIASVTPVSAQTYTVHVTGLTGAGTIELELVDDDTIVDVFSVPFDGVGTQTIQIDALTIDTVPPIATSITTQSGSPSTAETIVYDVTFGESVTGVGTDDFSIDATGVSDAFIASISGSGSTYSLTVNTGTTDGLIAIELNDDDSIVDTAGNPLGGVGTGNDLLSSAVIEVVKSSSIIGFVGEDLDVDGTSDQASVGVTVFIDDNSNGLLDAGEQQTQTVADDPVTPTVNEGGTFRFGQLYGVQSRVRVALPSVEFEYVSPATGEVLVVAARGVESGPHDFVIQRQVPELSLLSSTVSNVTSATTIDFTAVFDEPVTGVDITDFSIDSPSVSGYTVSQVTGSDSTYTITVSATNPSGSGTLRVDLLDDDSIVNSALAPLGGTGSSSSVGFANVQLDHDPPIVASIASTNSPIIGNNVAAFTVTFSEDVSGVDATDFAVAMAGGVSGASIQSVNSSAQANVYDVVVTSGTGDGTLGLNLVDNDTIIDVAGQPLGGVAIGNGDFVGENAVVERNPLRTISGTVFDDADNDGVRDAGEDGADGSQIYIDLNDDGELDTSTEPYDWYVGGGAFSFSDLPLGSYTLRVTDRLHFVESAFSTTTVDLGFDDNPLVVDVPATKNESAFVGVVFDDANQNGVRDEGESGIANQRVYWDSDLDGEFDSTETHVFSLADDPGTPEDETGSYRLSPLWYRAYQIRLDVGSEWLPTTSELASATITTHTQQETADFGVTANSTSISGIVFDDVNGDGLRQSGDNPVSGWTVYLDANDNGVLDSGESSQTTDASGTYSFDQLALGGYRVRIVPQSGSLITSADSAFVSLGSGTDASVVDFASHLNTTSVSGTLFDDANANGIQDAGEGAISGATIFLDSNNNARLDAGESTTTTSATGDYGFADVQPGEIVVRLVAPTAYFQTTPSANVDRLFVWHGGTTLREIDPTDGSTIADYWQSSLPTSSINADGLAFDGKSLWTFDRAERTIYQVDPDTATIESQIDFSGYEPATYGPSWNGLAIIGNTIHMVAAGGEYLAIEADSGSLISSGNLLSSNFGSSLLNGVNELLGLGASPDGQSLTATTDAGTLVTIDPSSLSVTDSDSVSSGFVLSGVGSVGGTTYVSQISDSSLIVFDAAGNQTGTLPIGCQAVAVAGGVYADLALRFTVTLDQQVTGADFGAARNAGNITGTQYLDDNGNGQLDAGEQPVAGVTVFADLDDNGVHNANEPFATSAADGTYTISGVPPGSVVVRAESEFHRPSDSVAVDNRLFALRSSSSSFMLINELDPASGSVVDSIFTSVPFANIGVTMALDGDRFIIGDNTQNKLFQIGLDGSLISSVDITGTDYGPVAIDGTIYSIKSELNGLSLYQFEPTTSEFTKIRPITYDWGLASMPVSYGPELPSPRHSSGVSADGTKILLATDSDRLFEIDPSTGIATFNPEPSNANGTDYGIDSLNGETFVSYLGRIEVLDADGSLLRNMTGLPTYYGLAGISQQDNAQIVSVSVGQSVTADHGHVSILSSISGVTVSDTNENGVADAGELPIDGATVYLDLDRNGALDVGEPTTITDASGMYVFDDVLPGDYSVRQVANAGSETRAFSADVTRLFQAVRGTNNVVVIQELDPVTGEVLNQFDAPISTATGIGLAAKDDRVYYSRSGGVDIIDASTGDVIDTIAISSGNKSGMAIIGDRGYVQDASTNKIEVVDLITQGVVGVIDIGAANFGSAGAFDLAYSLAEAPDGVNLAVVPFSGGDVSIVAPDTGLIVDTLPTIYAGQGSTSSQGEYFERGIVVSGTQTSISVRNHLGLFSRAIPVEDGGFVFGLGATSVPAVSHEVLVTSGQSLTGLDFGEVPQSRTISGVQFLDANDNEILDSGEEPIAGATVYADLNANGVVDAGEPWAISASDGSYTLTNVPRGSQWIRTKADGFESTSDLGTTDRMFGTTRVFDSTSATQYALQIREIDSSTGVAKSYIETGIPVSRAYTSAVWQDRLIVVDNGLDKLLQVTFDGNLISETPLPSGGGFFAYALGPAVIDDTVYVALTGGGDALRLERFDVHTNQFYGAMRISANVDQDPSITAMPSLSESVAESPDGKSIVLFGYNDERALVVDPTTAKVTEVLDFSDTGNIFYASATLGGELYTRGNNSSGNLNVYDANYTFVRTLGNPYTGGLAGGSIRNDGIVLADMSSTTNVNIGHRAVYSTVSGIVSYDTNVNGIVDLGEESVDTTVYLDSNRNGVLDAGELTTTTLADGSYSFSQLPYGDYTVAVDNDSSARVETLNSEVALYTLEVDNDISTIRRHDHITGETLRQFSAPGLSSHAAGLAVDDYAVYYSSGDGVWVLDHQTGAEKRFIDLPDGLYDGLAAIGGQVHLLDSNNDSIISIDPYSGSVLQTLDINAINNTSYDLLANLGESTDGNNLITRLPYGGGLVINPDSGVIEKWYAYNNGAWAIAGADGELFRPHDGTQLRAESEFEQQIRRIPIGYEPRAIAAGVIDASSYRVRSAKSLEFANLDFQLAPLDQFPATTISGVVWDDIDQDGVRDTGEAGLAGVTVYLDTNFNGWLDANDISQTTLADDLATPDVDESGSYSFVGLPQGVYDVRQALLNSYVGTSPTTPALIHDQRYDTDFGYNGFQDYPDDDLRLSETGRYLVYSTTRQILASDTNTVRDIYLVDRDTNEQELISVDSNEVAANNHSFEPDVSSDGRYVIFRTAATNLDVADSDAFFDVYVRDRLLGTTTLLTAGVTGGAGNGDSQDARITPDGNYVVLTSSGNQLVAGDTNNLADTFLFDLQSSTTQRISVTAGGVQLTDASSVGADISPDGRYVLFESESAQLVSGDNNSSSDVFRVDLTSGQIEIASSAHDGSPGDAISGKPSISDDGRWAVFESSSSNLTDGPHAGPGESYYVYLKDILTGDIQRIGETRVTGQPDGDARRPEISGDGRFVVFESYGELVPEDTNQRVDVYLYDRIAESMVLVSRGDSGELSRDSSNNAVISADGSTIAFTTVSSNIIGPNTTGGIVTVDVEHLLAQHRVSVQPGDTSLDNNFGQALVTGGFSGTLWQDENGNGVIDAGESTLAGRTVYIDTNNNSVQDAGEPTAITAADDAQTVVDESGSYEFAGLLSGDYTVRQILPNGWTQTSPEYVAGLRLLAESDYVNGVNDTTHPIYDSASSDNGEFIAFSTDKSMLPSDTNSGSDIYVIHQTTGLIELISQSTQGEIANGVSRNVVISGDGRFVVFRSFATNLALSDTNGNWDIFVRDRLLGTTSLVSSSSTGQVGDSFSYSPSISHDGSVVTFWSNSSNLVSGDSNGQFDVFLKDLGTGSIERINVDSNANQATGGQSHKSIANNTGQLVGFWSNATNLVAGDTNNTNDVFIRDRQTGLTERVSVSASGAEGNGSSDHFSMSDDGRFFVFQSNATNLTEDVGLSGNKQIFLKDRQTGVVTLISKGSALPDSHASLPEISADGRWITYHSASSNIVPGDVNGGDDVFLYDRTTGNTVLLSQSTEGGSGNGPSDWARISRDGSTITFNSMAVDLVGQPPEAGALYVYRAPREDQFVLNISIGMGQHESNANFGSQPMSDRGDAPSSFGDVSHLLDSSVYLGSTVSFETQAVAEDDDDGVTIASRLSAGFDGLFDVTTSTAGTLAAWIDFNNDGNFDSNERTEFSVGTLGSATTQTIAIPIPANASVGDVHARFRFSTSATDVQSPTGQASGGEVEDYLVTLESPVAATDVQLSTSSVNENLDTSSSDLFFASLSAVDEDPGDTHTYSLVAGAGDTDNSKFVIAGDELHIKQGETLDYEAQASYSIRVAATDGAGLPYEKTIELSVNNLVEISKQDITINDGSAQRSRVETVSIQFDAEVTIDTDAFAVVKRGASGGSVGVDFTTRLDGNGHTIADLTFSGSFVQFGSLADGNYQLTIDGAKITSADGHGLDADLDGSTGGQLQFGNAVSDKFFRYYGDINGDRFLNLIDYTSFRISYGKSSSDPNFRHALDYNDDEFMNLIDFTQFRIRYGKSFQFE